MLTMIGVARSKIFVSFAAIEGALDSAAGHYRTEHVWLISVQPYRQNLSGRPAQQFAPVHIQVQHIKEARSFEVNSAWKERGTSTIRGTILISSCAKASPEEIHSILDAHLNSTDAQAVPDDVIDHDPSFWLKEGLGALQAQNLVDKFDVELFMKFARAYAVKRAQFAAIPVVPYYTVDRHTELLSTAVGEFDTSDISKKVAPHVRFKDDRARYGGLM